MRVLVTGGAGFIGAALCRHLAGRLGWPVCVVDKLTYSANLASLEPVATQPGYAFVKADICDARAMRDVFAGFQPDAVIHLAAESHVDRSIDAPPQFVQTNVVGTAVLLETARAFRDQLTEAQKNSFRFLHVSTDEIYGSLGPDGAFSEDMPANPSSPYSATKAGADHLVSAWGRTYGLPVLISNCSNNYGPYQLCEKLIPLAILNARDELPIPIYGDGLQVRDWLHVEDHVAALLAVLLRGRPGERYNVGGNSERTNIGVVQSICDLMDRHAGDRARRKLIAFVADRPGHDRRYAIDARKIESELGWRPTWSFETGLEATVVWYLQHRYWWQASREAGHGLRRLGKPG